MESNVQMKPQIPGTGAKHFWSEVTDAESCYFVASDILHVVQVQFINS